MRTVSAEPELATVELSKFEAVVLLHAVTSLGDLAGEGMDFLPPERQPEVDALYGDLYRLVHEAMGS